jgi:hypothetical protein
MFYDNGVVFYVEITSLSKSTSFFVYRRTNGIPLQTACSWRHAWSSIMNSDTGPPFVPSDGSSGAPPEDQGAVPAGDSVPGGEEPLVPMESHGEESMDMAINSPEEADARQAKRKREVTETTQGQHDNSKKPKVR